MVLKLCRTCCCIHALIHVCSSSIYLSKVVNARAVTVLPLYCTYSTAFYCTVQILKHDITVLQFKRSSVITLLEHKPVNTLHEITQQYEGVVISLQMPLFDPALASCRQPYLRAVTEDVRRVTSNRSFPSDCSFVNTWDVRSLASAFWASSCMHE